jgi:hypothetical protein
MLVGRGGVADAGMEAHGVLYSRRTTASSARRTFGSRMRSRYGQSVLTCETRLSIQANATTFADLNSPALAHKTCSGVRLTSILGQEDWLRF